MQYYVITGTDGAMATDSWAVAERFRYYLRAAYAMKYPNRRAALSAVRDWLVKITPLDKRIPSYICTNKLFLIEDFNPM